MKYVLQLTKAHGIGSVMTAQHLMADQDTLDKLKALQFDLVLRDTTCWPADLLSEVLGIPSVDFSNFSPSPHLLPYYEKSHMIPNPIAYIPQYACGLTTSMVSPEPL